MQWNDATVPFARDENGPCFAAGIKTNLKIWGVWVGVAALALLGLAKIF